MPRYVIERQFLVPVFEQVMIEAANWASARKVVLDDVACPWSANARPDFENARAVTITEAVELPQSMVFDSDAGVESNPDELAALLYHFGLSPLPIPDEFDDAAQPDRPVGFG